MRPKSFKSYESSGALQKKTGLVKTKKYIIPEIMLVSTLLGSLSSNIYLTIGIYSEIALVRYVEGPTSARFVLFDAASISKIEINPHGMIVR